MAMVTLHIDGMSCSHCLNTVTRALQGVAGAQVKQVQIGRAEIEVAGGRPVVDALVAAVTAAGYPATADVPV